MDAHMNPDERAAGNRRNGYGSKQVQSSLGELTVQTPRDRDATFDPQFIKKRERILADSLSERIIGLYALGTSTREISELMENKLSAETISAITDRVLPELQSWRNRALDAVYPIVWLDAIHYQVMDDKNRPVSRAIHNVLGLCADGRKDKNKGVFTSDTALEKLVCLAYTRIRRKWTMPVNNWGQTAQQLAIIFGERFRLL